MRGRELLEQQAQKVTSTLYERAKDQVNNFNRAKVALERQGKSVDSAVDISGYHKITSPYPGVDQYEKKDQDGRTHQVWIDNRYNVTTYQLRGNSQDSQAGLLGTDGTAVIKLFGNNAYDFIKVDDYIDRSNLIIDAAMDLAAKLPAQLRQQVENELGQLKDHVHADLIQNANFDGIKDKARQNGSETFDAKHENALVILRQGLANVSELIANAEELQNKSDKSIDYKEVADSMLKQAEIDHVRHRGRPLVVKVGKIGEVGNQQFLSAQIPLGKETVPSSDRTGKYTVKLSNHVRDISGVIDEKGNVKVMSTVDGHSSYPPIAEKDEKVRRYVAFQAAQEKVKQTVNDMLAADPNLDISQPLNLSFATMMMLTPAVGKTLEKAARGAESEHGQLADTRYAIDMLSSMDQPIKINVGGKDVQVNVDFSFMNYPVNVRANMQKIIDDPLQKMINAKGFIKLKDSITARVNSFDTNSFTDPEAKALIGTIKNYFSPTVEISEGLSDKQKAKLIKLNKELRSSYKNAVEDLNKTINKEGKKLNTKLQELATYLKNYSADKNSVKASDYDAIRSKISSLREKVDKAYGKLAKVESNYYKNKVKNGDALAVERIIEKVLKNDSVMQNPDLKSLALSAGYFLKAEEMYHEKKYLHRENAYQFHVNYLLANINNNTLAEGFCKSAEDRTGWLRVSLMANQAFVSEKGRLPNLEKSEEREIYDKYFSSAALELSASLENTKYNSEARSLQVVGAFTNENYNIDAGKKISQIAKIIYKDLPAPDQQFDLNQVQGQRLKTKKSSKLIRATSRVFNAAKIDALRSAKRKTSQAGVNQNIPKQIDPADIQNNSLLLSDAQLQTLKGFLKKNGIKAPARIPKTEIAKSIGVDNFPYSIMVLKDQNKVTRNFAIYHGAKQKKHIASGAYGSVKVMQDLDSGRYFALKTQKHLTDKQKNEQSHEMNMLIKADQAVGSVIYDSKSRNAEMNAFVMELAPGKPPSIEDAKKMNPAELNQMLQNVIAAVDELHQKGILHRDIKPANMHRDENGKIRVVDFGTADSLDKKGELRGKLQGTPVFMSPRLRHHVFAISKVTEKIAAIDKQLADSKTNLSQGLSAKERSNFESRIKLLQLNKDELVDERKKLHAKEFDYTVANDSYSLGVTIGLLTGLANQYVPKASEKDFPHYKIGDNKAALNLPKEIKEDLIKLVDDLMHEPPKQTLAQAKDSVQSIFNNLEAKAKLDEVNDVQQTPKLR